MRIFSIGIALLAFGYLSAAADGLPTDSALEQGKQLLEIGEYKDATRILTLELESLRDKQRDDTVDTVYLLLAVAQAHAGLGKKNRCEAYFDEAISLLKQPMFKDNVDLIVEAFSVRSDTRFSWRDKNQIQQLKAIFGIAAQVIDDNDLRKANMAMDLGTSLVSHAPREDALIYLDQSYVILTAASSADPDPIGLALIELGIAYASIGQTERANELINLATTIGASTEAPITFGRVAPMYPGRCLSSNIRGEVHLAFRVGGDGRVYEVKETDVQYWRGRRKSVSHNKSCRNSLVEAAKEAASQFTYIPRIENGLPVDTEGVTTTITFEIQ